MDKSGSKNVVWDLSCLYHDIEDIQIKKDVELMEEKVVYFFSQYKGKLNTMTAKQVSGAINELELIIMMEGRVKSFAYLNLITQTGNEQASLFWQKMEEICTRVDNDLLFFNLEWASFEDSVTQNFMNDPVLADHRHYLGQIKKLVPYHLSEKEEKILAETSLAGINSWENLFDKVSSQMQFGKGGMKGKEIFSNLYNFDRDTRLKSSWDITVGLKKQSVVLTHILNAVLTDKMIKDKIRKYPTWVSYVNLINEVDDSIPEALSYAVKSKYDILQRYYRLKRELLGYDCLFDYDRYAPLSVPLGVLIRWDDGKEIVLNAFENFSPIMGTIARQFFDNKWIHAAVISGKADGSFSYPTIPKANPFIMVNYSGSKNDLRLLSHELGHGVHQFLTSKCQSYLNREISMIVAETVSSFAEMLVFQSLLDQTKDKEERLSLLCSKIEEIFGSIFRQIALFCFENAIHGERRRGSELSTEKLNQLWIETQKEMFGDSVILTDDYAVWWSCVPHFFKHIGYVYSYAFGGLLALSLFKKYKRGENAFMSKYSEMLKSGGKDSPNLLFKEIGVSLDDPDFWLEGLEMIEVMLKEIEELAKEVHAKV